jgi:hypothetical protein
MNLENIIKLKLNNFEIKYPVAKGDKPVPVQEAENIKKKDMIEPNPCWEGYEAIGTKIVDGREVPNCVPIKENQSKVKKEGFPIPSPSGDEDEQKYISRCISSIIDEYGQEQAAAICYSKWGEK